MNDNSLIGLLWDDGPGCRSLLEASSPILEMNAALPYFPRAHITPANFSNETSFFIFNEENFLFLFFILFFPPGRPDIKIFSCLSHFLTCSLSGSEFPLNS